MAKLTMKVRITGDKGVWGRLRGFGRVDFEPITGVIADIIEDDNRRGLRVGTDAFDQPLTRSSPQPGNEVATVLRQYPGKMNPEPSKTSGLIPGNRAAPGFSTATGCPATS